MTLLDDAPSALPTPDTTAPLPPEVEEALAILKAHALAELPGDPDDAEHEPDATAEDPGADEDLDEQDEDAEEPEPDDEAEQDPDPTPNQAPPPPTPAPATGTAPTTPPSTPTAAPAVQGGSAPTGQAGLPGRARSGELQDKVAHFLADEEGTEFTVTEVANRLGHSGGAVGNALETLAADGKIDKTNASPRTYKARHPSPYRPAPGAPRPATAPRPPRTHAPPAPGPTPASTTSATPAPPVKAEHPGAGIRRRNGQLYYPRKLGRNLTDIQALHKLREAGIPVLLEGPPGTGKTSLVEAAFPDLILVAGDGDTQVSDLVGSYTMRADGGYEFVYGPLITAMTEGRPLFLDDATLISPKVLAAMYPAMDGRREIVVKEHRGETVTATDGFYVIAGHNPGVHGAILTEALASRFATRIQVGTDWDLAVSLGVDERAVQIARNLATRQAAGDLAWSPQLRELLAFKAIHEVLGEDAAFGNLVALAPGEDREEVATVVRTILGKAASPLALGKQAKS
jgi:hypothetical protein